LLAATFQKGKSYDLQKGFQGRRVRSRLPLPSLSAN
jgi:hypothetical protein